MKAGALASYVNITALDSRLMTRFEAHKFARSAYEIGVNYIGGCCGTEPHHIRAFAQEVVKKLLMVVIYVLNFISNCFLLCSWITKLHQKTL